MSDCSDNSADINIVQGGNDPPIAWQFLDEDIPDDQPPAPDEIFDLTGSTLYLTVYRGKKTFAEIDTAADPAELVMDTVQGKLTWTPPLETTRELPLGRIAQYEIERRIGTTQGQLISGFVVVKEGRNSD